MLNNQVYTQKQSIKKHKNIKEKCTKTKAIINF